MVMVIRLLIFSITIVKDTIINWLLLLQKSIKLEKEICNNFRIGAIKLQIFIMRELFIWGLL